VIDEGTTPRQEIADDRRSLATALWGALVSGSATAPATPPPGARPTGAVRTALPVIYQLRQDRVSWPAQALAVQGGVGVPAIPLAA